MVLWRIVLWCRQPVRKSQWYRLSFHHTSREGRVIRLAGFVRRGLSDIVASRIKCSLQSPCFHTAERDSLLEEASGPQLPIHQLLLQEADVNLPFRLDWVAVIVTIRAVIRARPPTPLAALASGAFVAPANKLGVLDLLVAQCTLCVEANPRTYLPNFRGKPKRICPTFHGAA